VTNLLEAIDFISKATASKVPVDVVFIDFAIAFDVVPHKRLIHKLKAYGIKGYLLRWIKSFLTDRQQNVVMVV
jgi:hypothetical protein